MDDRVLLITLLFRFLPWIILSAGIAVLARSPLGRSLAHRLREGSVTPSDLALLSEELKATQRELSAVHERLDYAERLLTQRPGALPAAETDADTPTPPEPLLASR